MVQTVTLTREQQQLARAFNDHNMAQILTRPEMKSPPGWPWVGGSSIRDGMPAEPGDWFEYDAKGLRIVGPTKGGQRPVKVSVAWGSLRIYGRNLEPDLIRFMRLQLEACREHQRSYRLFAAPAEAVGCGPIPAEESEWTPAHRMYVEAHTEWVETMVIPHRAQSEVLAESLGALLNEAFPLVDGLCRCSAMVLAHLRTAACEEAA